MKKYLTGLFPFLIAAYPILMLRNSNLVYVSFPAVIRSLIISILLTAVSLVIFNLIFRNRTKAAVMTAVLLIAFFSYGHLYLALFARFGENVHHSQLLIGFGLLVVFGFIILHRSLRDLGILDHYMLIVSSILIILSIAQSAVYAVQVGIAAQNQMKAKQAKTQRVEGPLPDVYLIILDSHSRSDVLKDHYELDNSDFITGLEELGFYVANCSQSNYPTTKFSLTSLMYMNYLQDEFDDLQTLPPLGTSHVKKILNSYGYTSITFDNRSESHFDLQENIRLSRIRRQSGLGLLLEGMNEFESMLVDTSALRIFRDMPQLLPGISFDQVEYTEHFLQTKYILDSLSKLPDTGTPRFVYAHLLVPHEPFIFSPDGQFELSRHPIQGYKTNTQYIDTAIIPVLKTIIANSKTPPIIILQGDHGPAGKIVTPEMRLSILNAYHVNDDIRQNLYPTITPINSFRVIFNNLFAEDYVLLPDRSYYAYKTEAFTTENMVENTCQP